MSSVMKPSKMPDDYQWRFIAIKMDIGFETYLSVKDSMMFPSIDSLTPVMKILSLNSPQAPQLAKWFSQFLEHCKDSYVLESEIIDTPAYGETKRYKMVPARHLLIKSFGPPWSSCKLTGVQKFSLYNQGNKFQTYKISGGGALFVEITEARAEEWMTSSERPERLDYQFNHYPKP